MPILRGVIQVIILELNFLQRERGNRNFKERKSRSGTCGVEEIPKQFVRIMCSTNYRQTQTVIEELLKSLGTLKSLKDSKTKDLN